ncbi:hypothetical protein OHA70_12890 [Kribbella sp. NBC_00382]|uniref:hypothetical protein n=1 Tax=Kribbella sp. NBC_00382 TaxID=2975967 RepID=UPI002E1EC40D
MPALLLLRALPLGLAMPHSLSMALTPALTLALMLVLALGTEHDAHGAAGTRPWC